MPIFLREHCLPYVAMDQLSTNAPWAEGCPFYADADLQFVIYAEDIVYLTCLLT